MINERAIVQTINFAVSVIEENPRLAMKYLSMVPDVYKNRSGYKENIGIIELDAKKRLKQ